MRCVVHPQAIALKSTHRSTERLSIHSSTARGTWVRSKPYTGGGHAARLRLFRRPFNRSARDSRFTQRLKPPVSRKLNAGNRGVTSFLQRVFNMSATETGYWLGLVFFIGAIGTFLGGFLGDKLSDRTGDKRWYFWIPAISLVLMVPLQLGAYLAPTAMLAIAADFF